MAPMPVPATMSKKSVIWAWGSQVWSRIWSSRRISEAATIMAEVPPPSMLRMRVFLVVSQWESHFCSSLEKISSVIWLSSMLCSPSLSLFTITRTERDFNCREKGWKDLKIKERVITLSWWEALMAEECAFDICVSLSLFKISCIRLCVVSWWELKREQLKAAFGNGGSYIRQPFVLVALLRARVSVCACVRVCVIFYFFFFCLGGVKGLRLYLHVQLRVLLSIYGKRKPRLLNRLGLRFLSSIR